MEQLWNRGGATGGKRSGRPRRENSLCERETVATSCHRLPFGSHGKEGVDGSSPSEGSAKFLLISSFRWQAWRRVRASASTNVHRAPRWLPERPRNADGERSHELCRRRPPSVHGAFERECVEQRDSVFAAVRGEVDHRDARAHEAGEPCRAAGSDSSPRGGQSGHATRRNRRALAAGRAILADDPDEPEPAVHCLSSGILPASVDHAVTIVLHRAPAALPSGFDAHRSRLCFARPERLLDYR